MSQNNEIHMCKHKPLKNGKSLRLMSLPAAQSEAICEKCGAHIYRSVVFPIWLKPVCRAIFLVAIFSVMFPTLFGWVFRNFLSELSSHMEQIPDFVERLRSNPSQFTDLSPAFFEDLERMRSDVGFSIFQTAFFIGILTPNVLPVPLLIFKKWKTEDKLQCLSRLESPTLNQPYTSSTTSVLSGIRRYIARMNRRAFVIQGSRLRCDTVGKLTRGSISTVGMYTLWAVLYSVLMVPYTWLIYFMPVYEVVLSALILLYVTYAAAFGIFRLLLNFCD